MPRTIRCVHCHGSRRDVSLWAQIVDLGRPVVCCDGNGGWAGA